MEEGGPALPPAVPAAASTTSEKKNDDDSELKNTAKAKTKVDEVGLEDDDESQASSSDDDDEEEEAGVSAYERLRLERIQRNEARLKDLGLLDTKIGNKKKKKSGGKRKASQRPKNVPGAPPTREQPKRNKSRKSQLPEAAAASPKHHVNQIPKNSLKTSKTPSSSKPTKKRCGECEGCLLAMTSANEDCMACTNCLERLRSPVRGRRRCLFKQCRQRYVRLQKEIEKQQKQQQQEAQLKKDGAENENNTKSRDPAATTPSSTISQPNPEEVPSNCNTKDDGVATAIEKSVVEGKEETASLSGIKQEKEVEPQEEKKEEMEQHLAPSSPTIPANTKDDVQGSDDNTVPIPVPNSIASSCTKQETYETKAPGSAPAIASEEASTLVTKQDQTNYETVLQEPQQPQEEQELPPPPPRPTSCNICQLPTPSYFLVACSNCNKGYHSSCHVPKIRTLEDGWLCMDCIPKSTKQLPIEHGDGDDFPLGKGWLWGTTFGADLGIQPPPSVAKKRKKKKSTSARFTPSKRKQQQKRAVQEEPEPPSVLLNKLIKVKILDPSPVCLMCDEMICPSLGTSTSNDEANNESMLSIQCKACDEYYHWSCHHQMEKEGQELELKKKKKKIEESTEEGVGIAEKQEENLDNEGGRGDVKMAEPVDEANAVEAISEEEDVIATFPKGKRLALWKCYTCIRDSKELLPHHHPDNKKKRKRDRESIKKDQEKEAAKNGDDDDPLGKLQLFKGEPDDDCYICLNGGDLVCCDFCPKVFHLGCHVPKLPAFPTGIWKCCECYATDLQAQGGEMTRCGECSACMIKPCGECKACTNKKENECERKPECPNRSFAPTYEPGKIPGEIFTQQEIDELQNKRKKKKRSKKRKKVEPVEEVRYFDPNEESGDENAGDKGNQDCDLGRVVKLPIPKLKDTESVQIHKIMKAARKSPMDSKVQDKACEQLRKLVTPSLSPSECCVKIILAGGIELISKAMSQHPDKSILQAEASATISELVWAKPELAIKLAHMGIVQQIIRGMESFPVHPKVQHFGCSAFRSLSYEGSNIVVINNGYGITATLNSIKRNPKKLGVQKEACIFLQNMFVQSPDVVAEKMLSADVMDILVASLGKEKADADFKVTILNLIVNLTTDETCKKLIGESENVSTAIIVELQRSTNSDSVRQTACGALQNLASISPTIKYRISESGGVNALAEAIKSSPESVGLTNNALNLLGALINEDRPRDIEAGRRFMTEQMGIPLLLSAMKYHADTTTVQIAACEVISYLPFEDSDDNVQLAEAILFAMKNHAESEAVQSSCVDALLELAIRMDAVRQQLKDPDCNLLLLHAKSVVDDEATTIDVDDIVKLAAGGTIRRRR